MRKIPHTYLETLNERGVKYLGEAQAPSHVKNHNRYIKCLCSCGKVFISLHSNIVNNNSTCPECGQKRVTKIHSNHYTSGQILNDITGSKFIKEVPHGDYKKRRAIIECGKCHQLYAKIHSNHYTSGQILNDITGSKFIKEVPHGDYKKRRAIIECGKCHQLYEATIQNVINGSLCPKCAFNYDSKASLTVEHFLNQLNIPFKKEYTFPDLKGINNKSLRFDFCLITSTPLTLIEVDGEQHTRPIEYFGGEDSFKRLQINDEAKNCYALKHGYNLIRIPHTSFSQINENMIRQLLKGVTVG